MNILQFDEERLPGQVMQGVAKREKALRKARRYTQAQLAEKAGVSLGSLRRFEQTGRISFDSLVALMFALGCESELDGLFAKPAYSSIEEVIADARKSR